jgi:RhoGAP domain.
VLAGALKLFFRELKEPLIPYHAFNKALKASSKSILTFTVIAFVYNFYNREN